MAFNTTFWILLGIFIVLSIVRVVFTLPILKHLRERYSKVYSSRYGFFMNKPPIFIMFFSLWSKLLFSDLMFTNKLKLDNILIGYIRRFKIIALLNIASLIALIFYLFIR